MGGGGKRDGRTEEKVGQTAADVQPKRQTQSTIKHTFQSLSHTEPELLAPATQTATPIWDPWQHHSPIRAWMLIFLMSALCFFPR